jgi:DNA-binding protein HU-beta
MLARAARSFGSSVHSAVEMACAMRLSMPAAPARLHSRLLSTTAPRAGVKAHFSKRELSDQIAATYGLTKKDGERIVNDVLTTIQVKVAGGEKVSFIGFGTFEGRKRPARIGRNPKTGEALTIPERTVPVFSAGKGFKDAVSGKAAE